MAKKATATGTPQTLDRALDLISYMGETSAPMTIAEISAMLQVTRTTAYSMMNSLMQRGFIEKDPITGKYFLGYKLYQLGDIYCRQYTFIFVAERFLNELSGKWRVRVNISIFKPPMTSLILFTRDGDMIPRLNFGRLCPAYACSSGKCMLAFMPEDVAKPLIEQIEFRKFTPNTIETPEALYEELRDIREKGYSTDRDELVLQNRCVGAPIRNMQGDVFAALSLSGIPRELFDNKLDEISEDIIVAANHISQNLGCNLTFNSNR